MEGRLDIAGRCFVLSALLPDGWAARLVLLDVSLCFGRWK